jgi:hypothetical protein|nr:MAG TPA: hypothetical protein [Herelleviridae sp.]
MKEVGESTVFKMGEMIERCIDLWGVKMVV